MMQRLIKIESSYLSANAIAAILPDDGSPYLGGPTRQIESNRCRILLITGTWIDARLSADTVKQMVEGLI